MTISDINTLTRFLTKTNTTNFTAAQLLIFVNNSYERIVGKLVAQTSGGQMKFGDFNFSASPSFPVTMSTGVSTYDLTDWETNVEEAILTISGAEVQDNDGNWHTLKPITLDEIHDKGIALSEYKKTNGLPLEYEKRDNLIVLYPAPDNGVSVTLSGGLRIYHLRTADKFTSAEVTTGTKEPGFPSPWHDIISYESSYQYAMANGMPNAGFYKSEMDRKERELMSFIFKRNQDDRPIMTNKPIIYY